MYFREEIQKYRPINEQEESDQRIIIGYIDYFEKDILTRGNQIAHMTSSGLILNRALDKVLMIYHNIYNTWAWTGGHADGEGNMLEVALKEAKEETGVTQIQPLTNDLVSIDILPVYGHIKKGTYISSHLHLNTSYILIVDENEKLVINQEETSGVKWIDVDKLDCYSNEPYLIKIYNKMIKKARS